ncbi:MAG: peptidase domain-containing ABC transporter [Muribaculaceae bacterium]|nr:peptidase domain-containing ABC transporter [Muribaculaceae bacterium]
MQQFPIIRQRDAIQCGVACLQMICRHYGKNITFEALESICVPTVAGISLLGLVDAAKSLGFKAVPMQMSLSFLKRQKHPCILHWDHKHFVVLYKYHKNKFFVADPGLGRIEYSEKDFLKHWSVNCQSDEFGIGLVLEPTDDFYSNRNECTKKQNFSFSVLLKYIKQYNKHMVIVAGTLLITSILELILPFLTQAIVDIGIKNAAIKLIWLILLGEMMIVFGRTAIDFIRRWMLMHISIRLNLSLVSDFFIKLLRLPMTFFESKMVGDFLQRMEDHNRVQNFLTTQVLSLLFSGISFLILGSVLCFYNLLIFGIFVLGSIIYGLWISLFLHKRKVIDYRLFGYYAQNQEKTFQFITNIQEIKLQGCEKRRRWEWEDNQAELFTEQLRSLRLQQSQEAGSVFINEIKNILITVIAATSVIRGSMTLGEMLAVQYIIGQLNSPIEQLMAFINSYQDVKLSLDRINEIHSVREEEETPEQLTCFPEETNKNLHFKQVFFKYNIHSRKFTLDDINIIIPHGKITAIVGCSGSGKTTILKLLLGFFSPLKGTIYLGEKNITEYNPRWWRSHCGVVMQDGVIFSESIARNIAVDDTEIDFEKLEKAAKIAKIHDHIMNLPLKYNTLIGRNGVGLSQGQKQRILIARAVYKNPDFIFLDEATNALDAKNERDIVENLNEFYKGRTVIVVAHRLSTVKSADQIIVLDSGRVVETGNHNSLIDKKGAYYNLVKNQLELGR